VGVGLLNSFSLSLPNSHAPETNNGLQVPPPSNSYSRPPIPTKQTRCKGDTKQVLFHAAVIYRIAHHIGYSYPFGPSAKLGPAELIHGPGQQATHPTAQTYPLPLLTTHAMTQASLPPPLLASAPARALMFIDVPPVSPPSCARPPPTWSYIPLVAPPSSFTYPFPREHGPSRSPWKDGGACEESVRALVAEGHLGWMESGEGEANHRNPPITAV
jgi:hypothetical protein